MFDNINTGGLQGENSGESIKEILDKLSKGASSLPVVGSAPSSVLQMKLEVTIKGKNQENENKIVNFGTKTIEFLVSKCDVEEQPPGPS